MGQIILVRHGQASFGADDYDVLSPLGWEQGRALGTAWAGGVPTSAVTGSMRRHRETFQALSTAAGWSVEAEVDERWNEFDHLAVVAAHPDAAGAHDLDRRGFQILFEKATADWTAGIGTHAETFAGFRARVGAAVDDAAARSGRGQTTVVVTSGGVIAVVAALLTGVPDSAFGEVWSRFNTVCANSGLTRLVVGSTGVRLLTFNEHGHVSGELLTYR